MENKIDYDKAREVLYAYHMYVLNKDNIQAILLEMFEVANPQQLNLEL